MYDFLDKLPKTEIKEMCLWLEGEYICPALKIDTTFAIYLGFQHNLWSDLSLQIVHRQRVQKQKKQNKIILQLFHARLCPLTRTS